MSYYPDASFLISANHPRQFVDDIGIEIVFAAKMKMHVKYMKYFPSLMFLLIFDAEKLTTL